jgi:oxygen-dependent protoporphyrinogen oxidase
MQQLQKSKISEGKKVVVIGAGISGLTAAWALKQRFGKKIQLHLLEKAERAGGWIHTIHKDHFVFELGPHSFRQSSACPDALKMIESLQLQNQIVYPDPAARNRYLYCHRQLLRVPSNPASFLFSALGRKMLRGAWKDFWSPKGKGTDETIHDFFTRRFGIAFVETFIDPLVSGVYAGDPKQLSIKSCFPSLLKLEQEYGSLGRGFLFSSSKRGGIFSFKGGMQTLTQTLAKYLDGELKLSTEVKKLHTHSKGVEVELNNGESLHADYVLSAVAYPTLTSWLNLELPPSPTFSSVAVVSLGYNKQVLKNKGFGYLIPSSEKQDILGVIWDSACFPEQNTTPDQTRLTVIIGGTRAKAFPSEEGCVKMALDAVFSHLKIEDSPAVIHSSKASSAIPQYGIGHVEKIQLLEKKIAEFCPYLSFIGQSFYGSAVPDCIQQAINKIAQMVT